MEKAVQTATIKSVSAPIPVPSCDGEDPQAAYTFMQRFSQVGLANHWLDEVYIVQLGIALTGKALTWYNATLSKYKRLKSLLEWKPLKREFISEIACHTLLQHKARTALYNLKKSSRQSFYDYLIEASLHREFVDITDELFIELCLQGLEISHQYLMSMKDFKSITELSLSFQKFDIIDNIAKYRIQNDTNVRLNSSVNKIIITENLSLVTTNRKKKTNKKCMHCKSSSHLVKQCELKKAFLQLKL